MQNKIVWYSNADGQGTFSEEQVISTNVDTPTSVFAADLNNDSRPDIISASISDNKVAWYANEIPLDIEDVTSSSFILYPNPVATKFIIEGNIPFKSYSIYDSYGRLLQETTVPLETVQQQVFFSDVIATGVYFLKINFEENTQTIKFQKL